MFCCSLFSEELKGGNIKFSIKLIEISLHNIQDALNSWGALLCLLRKPFLIILQTFWFCCTDWQDSAACFELTWVSFQIASVVIVATFFIWLVGGWGKPRAKLLLQLSYLIMKLKRQVFFISSRSWPLPNSAILCRGYRYTEVASYHQDTKALKALWWKRKQFLFDCAYHSINMKIFF